MMIKKNTGQRIARLTAYTLVAAGIIPFVAAFLSHFQPALINWLNTQQTTLEMYPAIILSFLAGIHWGIGVIRTSRLSCFLFIESNVIALLAWATLFIESQTRSLTLLMIGFGGILIVDIFLNRQKLIPRWFFYTRIIVSTIVFGLLFATAMHT